MWVAFFFVFILVSVNVEGRFKPSKKPTVPEEIDGDKGQPLYLTQLLEKGEYKKAQRLSKVRPGIGNTTSYSGFFTVNKQCESNLFFWFFPAQKQPWKEAPLLLWLQGGPGSSSMFGIFDELGPFEYYKGDLKKREYSWNVENNLVIIDQPVGTGYSYTGNNCYPTNETEVAADLYEAVIQFHQLFPNFIKNRFFISGESYAGHYIPALAYAIYKNNPTAKVKINLTTLMIGDGWVDPVTQSDYGSYLYQIGLIDDLQRDIYMSYQDKFVQEVADEDWINAVNTSDALVGSLFSEFVGEQVDIYNYLPKSSEDEHWNNFITRSKIRKSLHVGNLTFQGGDKTYEFLSNDTVQSVKPWVEELLEVYPIVFYNGEVDIICAYPMTVNFLRSLVWSGESQWLNASRTHWCVGKELAGYYRGQHHLYDVLVRDAGHMVPSNQPLWAYTLVNSITSGPPENPLHALSACKS